MLLSEVEAPLEAYFARKHGIAAAYLFGSVARGHAGPRSDVDVAVLYQSLPADPLDALGLDMAAELTTQLHCKVDIVVMNTAPVDLVHRVLRDGVLVAEHDRAARIAFEVRARNEYFDILPWLRRYRRQPETMT